MLSWHRITCGGVGARCYNELIYSPKCWESKLPLSVEAVFYLKGATPADEARARKAHAALIADYVRRAGSRPSRASLSEPSHLT